MHIDGTTGHQAFPPGQRGGPAGNQWAPPPPGSYPGFPSAHVGYPPPGLPGYPQPTRPRRGRGLLLIGAAMLLVGITLGVLLPVLGFSSMSSALDDGHRVAASGGVIELTPGRYTVFVEGPGFAVDDSYGAPAPAIRVTGPDGASVPLSASTMSETYTVNTRSGRSIGVFAADRPGGYRLLVDRPTAGEFYVTQHSVTGSIAVSLGGVFLGLVGGGALAVVGVGLCVVGFVRRAKAGTSGLR